MELAQDAQSTGAATSHPISPSATAHTQDESHIPRGGSSAAGNDGSNGKVERPDTAMSQSQTLTPSRGGTLKKKGSLKRGGSLKRSGSRKSLGLGSVKSLALGDKEKYKGSDIYSAFFTPVPTKGQPTEILANRFQDWRRVLKDLVAYFREVQKSHDMRSKSLLSLSNLTSNMAGPASFVGDGGIGDATRILREYHRKALAESNKAKQIEEEVIVQLSGLRSDLAAKIKEIKSLSGDFKNSVEKEMEGTRKAVKSYQEALGLVDVDPHATSGKGDPFIVRLGVERQIDKQIDEENYLHKAFLNLESSGRELESIVVGEIQKAYNAYAGIMKRDADEAYEAVETLRAGPIAMAKDHEWNSFVSNNENFVDPALPVRQPESIHYPGKDEPAAAEVRAGMLERKSKYLKSYTPGWYVLSTTHLHEFKSPDRITTQIPVMSLYLQEQKLGSHSNSDSSSHKFMLKGRQTGGMHRGHGWVFRAESHDTMMAWYEDIRNLTEKTGEARATFVRKHARSMSGSSSRAPSISSDGGMDEDEADQVPYSANTSRTDASAGPAENHATLTVPPRPQPGGRFQSSDVSVDRGLQPLSPSSGASSDDRDAITAAGALPSSGVPFGEPEASSRGGAFGTGDDERDAGGAQDYQRSASTQAFIREANSGATAASAPTEVPLYTIDSEANATTPGPRTASRISPVAVGSRDATTAHGEVDSGGHGHGHPLGSPESSLPIASNLAPYEGVAAHDLASPHAGPATESEPTNPDITVMTSPEITLAQPRSSNATPTTTASILSDSTVQTEDDSASKLSRPMPVTKSSTATISDLHVPGEFPKITKA